FSLERQPGKILCTLNQVSKSYGDLQILKNASAEVNRGDKIALIGANGKGKSTLLRLIAQTEDCEGEIIGGHNADISFYAQHQIEALHMDHDILEELKLCGSGKTEQELRELMGCFLFRGDDVFKKIKSLSGGEKARVALAKCIISKANFLLLDEPTNHLDMSSVKMLVQAINQFEGTVVLVSHDRYFIQETARQIWQIEDGEIKIFNGTYNECERFKNEKTSLALPEASPKVAEIQSQVPKQNTSAFKEKQKEEKKLRSRFTKLEEEIQQLEKSKTELENKLAAPDTYANKVLFQETEQAYQSVITKLLPKQTEYEVLFEELLRFEESE
ncbi:MAG TPA: ABC transporter ATP-binding protein, partial [Chitinophagaceae bacterium]|nr:ABC transporter ATP-binding protein [Chitinophagaceae bacterium]